MRAEAEDGEDRVKKALAIAMQSGGVDEAHHKAWAIDQMIRALTGCPVVEKKAVDCNRRPYVYKAQGESPEYLAWVEEHNYPNGRDDKETYEWDVGIAP